MAWDFSTEPEFQEQLDWVEEFCRTEIEPLDLVFPGAAYSRDPKAKALADPLKQQVKDRGLWALFLDRELGGPGFGQLKLALLNEILGRYRSAPVIFGTAAPDTGNMEMLAAYGTEEQKRRWLYPLMNQEIFSAYSMTEPQGGSDPSLFQTRAPCGTGRSGSSTARSGSPAPAARADIIFVMCTNGMFVVPRDDPGRRDHGVPRAAQPHPLQRRARPRSTTCSGRRTGPRCWRSGAWAAAGFTTRCARWRRSSWPST